MSLPPSRLENNIKEAEKEYQVKQKQVGDNVYISMIWIAVKLFKSKLWFN